MKTDESTYAELTNKLDETFPADEPIDNMAIIDFAKNWFFENLSVDEVMTMSYDKVISTCEKWVYCRIWNGHSFLFDVANPLIAGASFWIESLTPPALLDNLYRIQELSGMSLCGHLVAVNLFDYWIGVIDLCFKGVVCGDNHNVCHIGTALVPADTILVEAGIYIHVFKDDAK